MVVAGSDFPGGHNPLIGFLRAIQLTPSGFDASTLFDCIGPVAIVDVEE